MAMSPAKNSCKGLTLIEVLIALAIISIALTAVIKAASQTIRTTQYLQDKTIALWVAREVIAEVQVGILPLPGENEPLTSATEMLDQHWYWQLLETATSNDRIKKIAVIVSLEDPTNHPVPLVTLESYVFNAAT